MSEESPIYHQDEAAAPTAEDLLASPSVSNWLKEALRSALARDPVDAAQDAEVLHLVLSSRADAILIADAARLGIRLPRDR